MHARRIDHLGAEVGKLHELGVGEMRLDESGGNLPRIGGHDAGDIGPELDGRDAEGGADQGRGVVGAAAAKCGGLSFGSRACESGEHADGIWVVIALLGQQAGP